MANNKYNAAYAGMNSSLRREKSSDVTKTLLNDYSVPMDEQPLPIVEIELSKITKRPINRYHSIENIELDESILKYGLINPIAVCHYLNVDEYVISAGERRYDAVTRLHNQFPDDPRFQKIECKVYILTDDKTYLDLGFPYITKDQEEGIYRDSNNLARQLSETDIASQIRYIVKRFDDPIYLDKLRNTAKLAGIKTYKDPDRAVLIASVMKSQNLWSNEKIRQYLKIYDAKNEKLLDAIENGEIRVNAAYKQIVDIQNQKRKRKTNKIQPLCKAINALVIEAKIQDYSDQDKEKIKECIKKLNEVLEQN